MFYSSKQLAKSLIELYKEHGNVVPEFLAFLKKKKILSQLPNILKHIESEEKRKKEFSELNIITKEKINDNTILKIKKFIKVPESVNINLRIDGEVKGGFVAKYDGMIYDASVKTQIEKIKIKLTI